MAYNYWLLEKGYAAHTGPRPGWTTGEAHRVWVKRARGWIKVMTLDAIAAMVCYTLVTVLFYILGAAILHRNGLLPEKNDMITQLGAIYTESLGPWAFGIFLGGALVVLFSTLFSALAAWTRLFSDAFSQLGWGDFQDPESRRKFVKGCAYVFPAIWGILFLTFQAPGVMVIIGGVATSFILLIVVYAAIIMHRRWAPRELGGGRPYRIAFVLSSLAILTVAAITGGKALGWIG
jgi:Mn2+/Fe2+ NRAMP family transporter